MLPPFYITDFLGTFENFRRPTRFATKPRDFCVLSYRLEGDATFWQGTKSFHAQSEDLVFIPRHLAYRQENPKPERLIAVHFESDRPLPREIAVCHAASPAQTADAFFTLLHAYERSLPLAQQLAAFYHLCSLIPTGAASTYPPVFRVAMAYFSGHYLQAQFSVSEWAKNTGISQSYLRTLCLQYLGVSPNAYLVSQRFARAKALLSSGYYTVGTVAALCGYENPKNFSTAFAKHSGFSPRDFLSGKDPSVSCPVKQQK